MKRISIFLSFALFAAMVIGCGGDSKPTGGTDDAAAKVSKENKGQAPTPPPPPPPPK